MIALSSRAQALAALTTARDIVVTSYTLCSRPVLQALFDAARRGAKVTVRLDGDPRDASGGLRKLNSHTVETLSRAGIDARLTPSLHMKALVCDGVAYLDDRNWTSHGDETIVRDDSAGDVRAVRDTALTGRTSSLHSFWTSKRAAERGEAALLKKSRAQCIDVETESFGFSGDVYAQLKRLATQGKTCRLIVSDAKSPSACHALDALTRAGVQIRVASTNEKFAVAGSRAWAGSANATWTGAEDEIDWAATTRDRHIVNALRARFDKHWDAARVYRAS